MFLFSSVYYIVEAVFICWIDVLLLECIFVTVLSQFCSPVSLLIG